MSLMPLYLLLFGLIIFAVTLFRYDKADQASAPIAAIVVLMFVIPYLDSVLRRIKQAKTVRPPRAAPPPPPPPPMSSDDIDRATAAYLDELDRIPPTEPVNQIRLISLDDDSTDPPVGPPPRLLDDVWLDPPAKKYVGITPEEPERVLARRPRLPPDVDSG